ncbi:MAG TPA: RagB/SusD family nutrient uptake outer membrane protein [Ohtaekwangia sp.]|nr:RagB/SusD family nutrient uptake outer membrane protein [Ohtaekwangia sp.]
MILTFITYTSCNEDILNTKPNSLTEADYFENELEFQRGVVAVYAKLHGIYWWNGGTPTPPLWQLPADDITTIGSGGQHVYFETFNGLSAGNGVLNNYYNSAYELILRANLMLQKLEEAEEGIFTTPGMRDFNKGEVLFLRGFMFFHLWNVFGNAPLITERAASLNDIFPFASEGTQLLDQAIAGFTEAAALLPPTWDEGNRGRVTKNSAYAFLGKALVFRGTVNDSDADLTAAITAFDNISGASLVDFEDNFAGVAENNAESLFEYQASSAATEENIWLPDEFNNAVGSTSSAAIMPFEGAENYGYGGQPFIATEKLLNAFEADDPRLPLTLDPATRRINKYVLGNVKTVNNLSSMNNDRILRYADVLLLKAEAILQSGGSNADAIALINQIRERARNIDGGSAPADLNTGETDDATVMQWIMDERFRELAFEAGIRWFDLKRWHEAGYITLDDAFFDSDNPNFDIEVPKHLSFPIPTSETDRNTNIAPNPDY